MPRKPYVESFTTISLLHREDPLEVKRSSVRRWPPGVLLYSESPLEAFYTEKTFKRYSTNRSSLGLPYSGDFLWVYCTQKIFRWSSILRRSSKGIAYVFTTHPRGLPYSGNICWSPIVRRPSVYLPYLTLLTLFGSSALIRPSVALPYSRGLLKFSHT